MKWWREVVDKVFFFVFRRIAKCFCFATFLELMFFFFDCHQQMDLMYRFTIDEMEFHGRDLEVFCVEQIEKLNGKLVGVMGRRN